MNILYVTTSYLPSIGGAQIHLHSLAKVFSKNHRVEVIAQLDKTVERWLLGTTLFAPLLNRNYYIDYIPVRQINFSLPARILLAPLILPYYFTQEISTRALSHYYMRKINDRMMMDEIDIVHSGKIGREYLSLGALKLARRLKVPFVFTPTHHPGWEGWMHRAYLQICRQADALIVLTNGEKDRFIKLGVNKNRIFVTGHAPILSDAYNADNFKKKFGINDKMVLFLGQKYAYKGFNFLIKAADIVNKKFPLAKFVFIGPRTRYSKRLFAKNRFNQNIIEIPPVSLEEKTSALAACDILCLPSSQESFGGVFLEAWSFNKPVLGADIYAVKEVIDDGKDGFIIKRDAQDIADKIIHLLENPYLRDEMGKRGREKVDKMYNWQNIANLTEQVYKSLISN